MASPEIDRHNLRAAESLLMSDLERRFLKLKDSLHRSQMPIYMEARVPKVDGSFNVGINSLSLNSLPPPTTNKTLFHCFAKCTTKSYHYYGIDDQHHVGNVVGVAEMEKLGWA